MTSPLDQADEDEDDVPWGPDATFSQMLGCRFIPNGCAHRITYQLGERDQARRAIDLHEYSCPHRFVR